MSDDRAHQPGETFTFERSFTDEDVIAFQKLSGDEGRHHAEPDASGRRMVHGLLTASLPTKLGGDLDYVAREMHFEFKVPVYTGDRIRCEMTIVEAAPGRRGQRVALEGVCVNQDGIEVLRFQSRGVVLDRSVGRET